MHVLEKGEGIHEGSRVCCRRSEEARDFGHVISFPKGHEISELKKSPKGHEISDMVAGSERVS